MSIHFILNYLMFILNCLCQLNEYDIIMQNRIQYLVLNNKQKENWK